MIFFDFVFYVVHRTYEAYNEKSSESTAAGIVGGLWAINVLSILLAYSAIQQRPAELNKVLLVILFIVFQVITYMRYLLVDSHSAENIQIKWQGKSDSYRQTMKFLIKLYIVFSFVSCFCLAIYLGYRSS